ncbi:MAG: TRAP transporter small permease subunit [Rhodothalassiaceae bacterium]
MLTAIDRINKGIGVLAAACGLALILVQFGLVLAAHVFNAGSIAWQDSRFYLNGFLFLGAAGYALATDAHVRVDLFYREAGPHAQAMIDLLGLLVLLAPVLFLVWWTGLPYVLSSWQQREGAIEAGALPYVYLLKSALLLFALTLSLQAIALGTRCWVRLFRP